MLSKRIGARVPPTTGDCRPQRLPADSSEYHLAWVSLFTCDSCCAIAINASDSCSLDKALMRVVSYFRVDWRTDLAELVRPAMRCWTSLPASGA